MEIQSRTVQLSAADGQMPAYECQPVGKSPSPAVIVIMEAFGLNSHIKDVTARVAREGYVAVAPDLYYRFGSPIIPYEDLPKAIGYLQQLRDDKIMGDVSVAIAHLKRQPFVSADRIGIMGFCMGGKFTFLAAAKHADDIKAAVSFYGGGIAADAPDAPINLAGQIKHPILCFFGEKDPLIPIEQAKKVEETIKRPGKLHDVKIYTGATHGFFCNERQSYHPEAAKDAWEKTKAWFARHL